MTELLSAEQMRAVEGAAIASGGVTGLQLMECAGRGVVEAMFEEWPEFAKAPHRAVVLCGPGNNGGDGFVVARLLAEQHWEVEVFLFGDRNKLPPDAQTNCDKWLLIGAIKPLTLEDFRKTHPLHGNDCADVYLDALFGTGLTRAVAGDAYDVLRYIGGANEQTFTPRIVSVDAPSGLCLDSGKVLAEKAPDLELPRDEQPTRGHGGVPFKDRFAALTVTFDSPKVGHFIAEGPTLCGKLVVKGIGIEGWRWSQPRESRFASEPEMKSLEGGDIPLFSPPKLRLVTAEPLVPDRRDISRVPFRQSLDLQFADIHKFDRGHALVLSGSSGRTGAARLAARGALRIGAGLVTVAAPGSAMMECACQLTAIMLRRCDGPDDLTRLLHDKRLNSLCLGPGLGLGEGTRALVHAALASMRPTVLDADALTSFAEDPRQLFEKLHSECILTPHAGEFARLFPDIAMALAEVPTRGPAFSKVNATRQAAERAGCVVLYKGPDTVIALPDGRCAVHAAHYDRTAPWLATAGAGDVLAGILAGLLARGAPVSLAAETSVWLHVECARAFGPGLIAEDLPEVLPQVLAGLLT